MKLNLDMVIQDPELMANGAGDHKYTLYVFDNDSNVEYYIRFKTYGDLEERLIAISSIRYGIVSAKVLFLLSGDEGVRYPYINKCQLYRKDRDPYQFIIVDGMINKPRLLYAIMTHDK